MKEPQRCPGNDIQKTFKIFSVTCKKCGEENEVYSDELYKKQNCSKCKKELDLSGL